jgi:ThiF family
MSNVSRPIGSRLIRGRIHSCRARVIFGYLSGFFGDRTSKRIMLVRWTALVLVVVAMVGITTTTTTTGLVSPMVSKGALFTTTRRVRSNVKFWSLSSIRRRTIIGQDCRRTTCTMTAQATANEEYSREPHVASTAAAVTPTTTTAATCLSHEEIARYSRHLVLDAVGVRGQEALRKASVLVIGAGGLGSPVLLYLAAAGIGRIGIVDGDTVDTSNLQRQIIHSMSSVGMTKCESAQRRIEQLNPHVQVRLYEYEFTASTAHDIVGLGFDDEHAWNVVVDGSDNFPTKYLIK